MMNYTPFPNRRLLDPSLDPSLSGSEQGRQTLFATALSNLGYKGTQYQNAMKLYEPQFGNFLAYQGNQLQGGAQAPTWVDYINQTFDPTREMVRNPGTFQRRTPSPLRYFYR